MVIEMEMEADVLNCDSDDSSTAVVEVFEKTN